MFLSGHKTKESYIQDIAVPSEMIKIAYLDRGIITFEQYESIKSDVHRGRLINAIVERALTKHALWDLHPSSALDIIFEQELDLYIANEFANIPHDPATIKLVIYEADIVLEVLNLLPDNFDKATWAIWQSRIVGITLVIQNQGDYRAISYFGDDAEHMQLLKDTYTPEVLYQHE